MTWSTFNWKLVATGISATILYVVLAAAAWQSVTALDARMLNLSVLVLGTAVGWLIGIFASPYHPEEKQRFSDIAKAVSLFVSGYLVGKVDRLINDLLESDLVLQPLAGLRTLSFVATLFISMVVVYASRPEVGPSAWRSGAGADCVARSGCPGDRPSAAPGADALFHAHERVCSRCI
jgi:hypothetical protein